MGIARGMIDSFLCYSNTLTGPIMAQAVLPYHIDPKLSPLEAFKKYYVDTSLVLPTIFEEAYKGRMTYFPDYIWLPSFVGKQLILNADIAYPLSYAAYLRLSKSPKHRRVYECRCVWSELQILVYLKRRNIPKEV